MLAKAKAQAEGLKAMLAIADPELVRFYLALEKGLFTNMAGARTGPIKAVAHQPHRLSGVACCSHVPLVCNIVPSVPACMFVTSVLQARRSCASVHATCTMLLWATWYMTCVASVPAAHMASAVHGLNPKINIWTTGDSASSGDGMAQGLRNLFTNLPPMLVRERAARAP